MGDFRGESLILRLFLNILVLPATLKLTEAAENKFMGLTNTDGNLLMEWGIRKEAECNLRGDIVSLILLVILMQL